MNPQNFDEWLAERRKAIAAVAAAAAELIAMANDAPLWAVGVVLVVGIVSVYVLPNQGHSAPG